MKLTSKKSIAYNTQISVSLEDLAVLLINEQPSFTHHSPKFKVSASEKKHGKT